MTMTFLPSCHLTVVSLSIITLMRDLSEYDLFIIPSEGSVDELEELGAREVIIVFRVSIQMIC